MQWDVRLKGLHEEARIARLLARWRNRVERQVQRFASDRVSLRGVVERHPTKRRFRVMLLLSVPGRIIVAREEGASLDPVVKDAFAELLRQLAKHQAMLRREPLWKRRDRRHAASLASTIRTVRLEERDREALLDLLESHLDTISRFAAHDIAARLAAGDLFPGQLSVEDVVDAVVLAAAEQFPKRPQDLPLDRWLMKLVLDQVEREVRRTREEGGTLRLEEACAMPGSEEGLFDLYQPDEILRLVELLPEATRPSPEQVGEREELQRTINQMLARLPKQWRLAIVLHQVEGCSLAETALVLGISEADVREALDRARAFLRQQVAERYPSAAVAKNWVVQETAMP